MWRYEIGKGKAHGRNIRGPHFIKQSENVLIARGIEGLSGFLPPTHFFYNPLKGVSRLGTFRRSLLGRIQQGRLFPEIAVTIVLRWPDISERT